MPLGLFRHRNLSTANSLGVLWAGALFAWFFLSALYLQGVLHYSSLQVGLAFLPATLIMGGLSLGVSAMLVMRFGLKRPLAVGLLLAAAGLALFTRLPVHGNFAADVLPSMILLGLGGGIVFNPMLLAAMGDVPPEDSGLASGLVNTSFMMGGALGLACSQASPRRAPPRCCTRGRPPRRARRRLSPRVLDRHRLCADRILRHRVRATREFQRTGDGAGGAAPAAPGETAAVAEG